jgi:hypothetical protein
MAVDQASVDIDPWYDELIKWPEDRFITPEEKSKVLRKVIMAMTGVTESIKDGTVVRANVKLEIATPADPKSISFNFDFGEQDHDA